MSTTQKRCHLAVEQARVRESEEKERENRADGSQDKELERRRNGITELN